MVALWSNIIVDWVLHDFAQTCVDGRGPSRHRRYAWERDRCIGFNALALGQ
mgnify:CR=1 FL=1